jgi:hypothetical protein
VSLNNAQKREGRECSTAFWLQQVEEQKKMFTEIYSRRGDPEFVTVTEASLNT